MCQTRKRERKRKMKKIQSLLQTLKIRKYSTATGKNLRIKRNRLKRILKSLKKKRNSRSKACLAKRIVEVFQEQKDRSNLKKK